MGISGTGNLDSDAALDLVQSVVDSVREELCPPTEFEDIPLLMGAVEVYRVLVEHCQGSAPDRTELEQLRDKVLAVYDKEKDAFTTDANASHIEARRDVINDTFAQFLRLCVDQDPSA